MDEHKPRKRRGAGRVTLNTVARQAGVSAITVSRYFNQPEQVSPERRGRIAEVVAQLGYVPNLVAGGLAWVSQPLPLRLGLAIAVIGGVVAGVLALPVMLFWKDRARFYSYLHRVWSKTSDKPVWMEQAEKATCDFY